MMQELQKFYADIPVPPNLQEDILTYCRTAQKKPKPLTVRYAKPLALLAACVAVLFVSLAATGHLFSGRETNLPVGVPENSSDIAQDSSQTTTQKPIPENATTTKITCTTMVKGNATAKDTFTTTVASLDGTGGDEGACTEHYMEYHTIFSSVYQLFGDDADSVIQAFSDKYKGEDSNIINFVKEYNINKETFMRLNGFTEDNWDEPWEGTATPGSIIIGEYVDAIYSNDPAKIDAVFKRKETPASLNESTTTTTTVSLPRITITRKPN